ncbi:maleylacetoacetate isomerase [Psychrosphaera aestuarii]|uniref:maleylacetoacetate isomerase n=1 Tax=Psychrosphaera aestuarii TaxID=1266052 RepID=UPI001B31D898|nr:maleylacetoacetate isomerase [Psychrosphaera aestuarii]
MKLFGYWRSSAAYRVRIALNLKQLDCELISVHLVKDGGQQHSKDYQELNPNELVPTLVDGDFTLNQSLAILDYLEQKYPQSPLLPTNIQDNVKAKALAFDIACDIHPLNNLRVLQYLTNDLNQDDDSKATWYKHWISVGFASLEKSLARTKGLFCYGDEISWADICLIPQVYNAERFNVDMTPFPNIMEITSRCRALPEFWNASPEQQEDAS